MLREREVDAFVSNGFLVMRGAVPRDVIRECQKEIDTELLAHGVDPEDRSTWTSPVVRFNCPDTPAFAAAGTQPALWEIYDQLLGTDTWWKRQGVGGTIPVRFPHEDDPGDAGWHIDLSFDGDESSTWRVNYRSKGRGLLALFLLSDVGDEDAPTELKLGSHLEVPKVLRPFGDEGTETPAKQFPVSIFERRSIFATGQAGDVFVCHPFLVHRATWPHRGTRPRAIAQPAVAMNEPFALDGNAPCPVEQAILLGLDG